MNDAHNMVQSEAALKIVRFFYLVVPFVIVSVSINEQQDSTPLVA